MQIFTKWKFRADMRCFHVVKNRDLANSTPKKGQSGSTFFLPLLVYGLFLRVLFANFHERKFVADMEWFHVVNLLLVFCMQCVQEAAFGNFCS